MTVQQPPFTGGVLHAVSLLLRQSWQPHSPHQQLAPGVFAHHSAQHIW
eukprot:SAG31_NODE_19901_length_589_cov_0.493878_1_plen_47_part_10